MKWGNKRVLILLLMKLGDEGNVVISRLVDKTRICPVYNNL